MAKPKVVLISTDESRIGMGIKTLSACLVESDFDTSLILMPTSKKSYEDFCWDNLEHICKDACLIGISCMTHGVQKAIEIKKKLSKRGMPPIVIGGIHASLDPQSLLSNFNLICHGEGEDLIVKLAQRIKDGASIHDLPGLWVKNNGAVIKNKNIPLGRDINNYPIPDYCLSHQYILEGKRLVPMRMVPQHVQLEYFVVLGSRGCPHHCAYCSNQKIKKEFPWREPVRHYSVTYLIDHLKEASRVYPDIRSFWIDDDTFFAKPVDEIAEFAQRYREEIRKPFLILISPWTFNEEKTRFLIDAGMKRITMGIQSGSENINNNIYDRRLPNKRILEIVRSLNKYSKDIMPSYDFIILNPFENENDLISTIKLIRSFPSPFFIFNNALAFYPGTKLYEQANKLGLEVNSRNKHMDLTIGYAILKTENIQHKLFHLILLLMGGDANHYRIGLVSRSIISDYFIKFYSILNKKFGTFINCLITAISFIIYGILRRVSESAFCFKIAKKMADIYLKIR